MKIKIKAFTADKKEHNLEIERDARQSKMHARIQDALVKLGYLGRDLVDWERED